MIISIKTKKMNKKAQIFGEPFIFIFAIVVAAMVLMFGIKIYYQLSERADFAQVADIAQRINEDIITFYNLEEGSSNMFSYVFPNTVDCICFVGDNVNTLASSLTGYCADTNGVFETNINYNWGTGSKLFWKYSEKKRKDVDQAHLPDKYQIRSKFVVLFNPPAGSTTEPISNNQLNPLCFDLVADKHVLKVKIRSLGDKVLVDKLPP